MSSHGLSSTSNGDDFLPMGNSQNPFEKPKKIAYRPRGENYDEKKFWLKIVFEQDGYNRPDSFDMSELLDIRSLYYIKQNSTYRAVSVLPENAIIENSTRNPSIGQTPEPPPFEIHSSGPSDIKAIQFETQEGYNELGNKFKDLSVSIKKIKTVSDDSPITPEHLHYISLGDFDFISSDIPNSPYKILNEKVKELTRNIKITDTRNGKTTTYLTECLNIVRGLHVNKASSIDNIIEPLYVVLEGIQWQVQNIDRLSKRVLAEIDMLNIEITRRLTFRFNLKKLLAQTKQINSNFEYDPLTHIVSAVARCLDAQLTFAWYKHNSSVSKHLTDSRKRELEGEVCTLLMLIEDSQGNLNMFIN